MTHTYTLNELEGYGDDIHGVIIYASVKGDTVNLFIRTPTEQDEQFQAVDFSGDDDQVITIDTEALARVAADVADYYGEFADGNNEMGGFIIALMGLSLALAFEDAVDELVARRAISPEAAAAWKTQYTSGSVHARGELVLKAIKMTKRLLWQGPLLLTLIAVGVTAFVWLV